MKRCELFKMLYFGGKWMETVCRECLKRISCILLFFWCCERRLEARGSAQGGTLGRGGLGLGDWRLQNVKKYN